MDIRRPREITWAAAIILALVLPFSGCSGATGGRMGMPAAKSDKTARAPAVQAEPSLNKLGSGNADAVLAQMTDEQVRRLLIEELKRSAAAVPPREPGPVSGFARMVQRAHDASLLLDRRLAEVRSGAQSAPDFLPQMYAELQREGKPFDLVRFLPRFALLLLVGIMAEWLFRRSTRPLKSAIETTPATAWVDKVKCVTLLGLFDLAALMAFTLATLVFFFLFYDDGGYKRLKVFTYLGVVAMVRGMGFLSQRLLSPRLPLLRPLPLDDGTAASIYSWAVRLLTVAGLGLLIHVFMELERASEALVVTVRSVTGLAVVTLFFFALWQHRRAISARIRTASSGNANQSAAFRERLARTWLFFTAPYLAGLWAIWVLYTLMEQVDELIPILALWLSVPFFLAANGILQKLLDAAFSMSVPRGGSPCEATALEVGEGEEATPRPPAAEEVRGAIDVSRHVRILRRLLSFSIGAAIFFRLMALWGFDVELGHHIATATTRASIAILLAFVTWKLIETAISRRLREVEPFDALDDEHEMGGEGGSRIGTLLYLLRKFVLIGLFCAVTLIVLAALGVNITPLLAGAGVIGLAIGFGSQTLVKDIVSGIFYLIDDAFRIGDYVDTGKLQGTVEHISIRSFKLRHARGQVHTIPFSSLSSVTNFSRDYTIEKIRFRVPFDTDLKKVKKIIKKINVDIREDTEMASILLGDIKSQGVREVDDSALVMRIKFKTRPGGQFIIRREVYDRLKKAFEKAGLEFAHRHVVVRLPHEAPTAAAATTDTAAAPAAQGALAAGAGAAIAQALVMEELERKTKGEGEP